MKTPFVLLVKVSKQRPNKGQLNVIKSEEIQQEDF
jgi:hypothetical protein